MNASLVRRQRLLLVLIVLVIAWAIFRFVFARAARPSEPLLLLVDCPWWLLIGFLVRVSNGTTERSLDLREAVSGILPGCLVFVADWFLPLVFPNLDLTKVGIEIDLLHSPVVFVVAVAFMLGFHGRVIQKLLPAAGMEIKKLLGVKEDPDQKGNARYRREQLLTTLSQLIFPG
jgi:hypothetical protein